MSDDILEQATRALRAETEGNDQSAPLTRSRVLRSTHQTERRRRSYVAFLVPIAAVLVGSTAFAASGGSWKAVARAMGLAEPAAAPAPVPPTVQPPAPKAAFVAPAPKPEPEPEPEPETAPDPAAETAPVVTEAATPAPTTTTTSQKPSAKTATTKKPVAPPEDLSEPEIALYREAHRLHFGGGSPAAALAAWDGYLAKSPRGRFAAEASYNRAIALARLGRTAEAKAALQPFANGSYGNYRKESAQQLIDGLDGR